MLTIHDTFSIGASLQAYALGKKLKELGHEPCLIAYSPYYFQSIYDAKPFGIQENLKNTIRSLFTFRRDADLKRKFIQFKHTFHPPMSKRYLSRDEIIKDPPIMDAYVCGSDQIWNPEHIMYDDTFFCGFEKRNIPKISYAASIGLDVLNEKDKEFLKLECSQISHIGVREDKAVELLSELGIKAEQNIDPTLLYKKEEWEKLELPIKRENLPKKYILYYPLSANGFEQELLLALKQETGLPCVVISPSLRGYKNADYQVKNAGPQEYLWLIHNAEIVITNSFHALSFSIIYEKKFVLYPHKTRNSRLESLLRLTGMSNRLVFSIEEFKEKEWDNIWNNGLDFCNDTLTAEREKADNFLRESLDEY